MLKRFRELSIREYVKEYERFGVQFDVYAGESLVSPENIKKVTDQLEEQGLLLGQTREDSHKPNRKKRAAVEIEEDGNDHNDTPAEDLALAIDLDKFRLGKPVLQNTGAHIQYIFILHLIIEPCFHVLYS